MPLHLILLIILFDSTICLLLGTWLICNETRICSWNRTSGWDSVIRLLTYLMRAQRIPLPWNDILVCGRIIVTQIINSCHMRQCAGRRQRRVTVAWGVLSGDLDYTECAMGWLLKNRDWWYRERKELIIFSLESPTQDVGERLNNLFGSKLGDSFALCSCSANNSGQLLKNLYWL